MKMLKLMCFTFALFIGFNSNANLIQAEWNSEGDAFIDSDTGLGWLNLNYTEGLSMNYVSSQFGEGTFFDGWRLATHQEVEAVTASIISPLVLQEGRSFISGGGGLDGISDTWFGLFGGTSYSSSYSDIWPDQT